MASKFVAALAVGLSLIASQAVAAEASISGLKGQVMINRDGKMVAAAPGALKTGDRVVAMDGAAAKITYADGCAVTLQPQAMATIGAKSPCVDSTGLVSTGESSAQLFGSWLWTLVFVVGVGWILVEVLDDDDDPISN